MGAIKNQRHARLSILTIHLQNGTQRPHKPDFSTAFEIKPVKNHSSQCLRRALQTPRLHLQYCLKGSVCFQPICCWRGWAGERLHAPGGLRGDERSHRKHRSCWWAVSLWIKHVITLF